MALDIPAPGARTSDADRYLRRIAGGPGHSFWFRAIHDRDKGRPAVNIPGTLEQCLPRLARLNQTGYGIFVIVNEFDRHDRWHGHRCPRACSPTSTARRGDVLAERKARLLYFAGSPISVNIKGHHRSRADVDDRREQPRKISYLLAYAMPCRSIGSSRFSGSSRMFSAGIALSATCRASCGSRIFAPKGRAVLVARPARAERAPEQRRCRQSRAGARADDEEVQGEGTDRGDRPGHRDDSGPATS